MAVQRNRPAYQGSTRRARLPANWEQLREEGRRRNPQQLCHKCGRPGGTSFDHKQRGEAICQRPAEHDAGCQCNLDWIHDWRDVKAGRSKTNCHGRKTGQEGAGARLKMHDEGEPHPAFG